MMMSRTSTTILFSFLLASQAVDADGRRCRQGGRPASRIVARHRTFVGQSQRSRSIRWTASSLARIPRGGQRGYENYNDQSFDDERRQGYSGYSTSGRGTDDAYDDYHARPEEDATRYDDEDRGYYDDTRGRASRYDEGGTGGVMSKLQLPNIIKTGNRRIGMPLLGIGAVLTVLGISLFFNKTLMRLGNLFFVAGVPLTIGPGRTAGYFFQPTKARATGCLALGIFLVFVGWPVFGIILEVFGLLNLFGNMFPLVMVMLKTMPGIGPLLRRQGGGGGGGASGAGLGRPQGRYRSDRDDDDYDYGVGGDTRGPNRYRGTDDDDDGYGGVGYDRGFDDRNYYDDGVEPDGNQRYY